MQRLSRALRRIFTYLTRSKALVGWLLILFCSVLYATVPDETVRQFALVLGSVAAGAIFLPELSSELWTIRADQIRKTIPEERIARLQQELIAAATNGDDWSSFIWSEALSPMQQAAREPLQVQWHLTYDIRVYLDQIVEIDGQRSTIHRVESLLRSERVLPVDPNSRLWVSIARTHDSLLGEYGSLGCLVREHVHLPDVSATKWREVMVDLCSVHVTVNGRMLPMEIVSGDNLDVVRWEAGMLDGSSGVERVPVMVAFSFPLGLQVVDFPVLFGSYYCAGQTEVSFAVHHPTHAVELDVIDFCTRRVGGARHHGLVRKTVDDARLNTVIVATGKDSVLWPGSGMLFQWKTRT